METMNNDILLPFDGDGQLPQADNDPAGGKTAPEATTTPTDEDDYGCSNEGYRTLLAESNHKLPRDAQLPPVFRELVGNAPQNFKTATFIAASAPLACLATRLRFYYPFDLGPMACLLQTIICAEQSGGKSFVRHVESVIMEKQKQRDNEQRRLEQDYRALKQKASKNERLPDPPKTAIVCCPVSISIAQLIKRADAPVRLYGTPLTLWTFTEELATATESSRRSFSNIKSIMRTAYDLGSEYGVDYMSDNSYSASVDILYNTMFCTTPSALDEYMDRKAIEGGNCTRTIIYDLGSQLGDEAPMFKRITPQQQQRIDRTIDRMMNDTYADDGVKPEIWIDMAWLDKDVKAWCKDKNDMAIRSGSTALGVFFKRSSVSAFRIAALCQYLYSIDEGERSSRNKVREIYYTMADQILVGMLDKWGRRYEELQAKRMGQDASPKLNLFDQLPREFGRELLRQTIKRLELSTPERVFLSKWRARGLVEKVGKNTFRKN